MTWHCSTPQDFGHLLTIFEIHYAGLLLRCGIIKCCADRFYYNLPDLQLRKLKYDNIHCATSGNRQQANDMETIWYFSQVN
jgi:hypothetical protein